MGVTGTPYNLMNEQAGCPLFRLPPELREVIYRYCCKVNGSILNPGCFVSSHVPWRGYLGIALMRTCRRVYAEFDVRALYSNTFVLADAQQTLKFIGSLSVVQKSFLTTLTIDVSTYYTLIAHGAGGLRRDRVDHTILHYLVTGRAIRESTLGDMLPQLHTLVIDIVRLQHMIASREGDCERPRVIWDLLLPYARSTSQPRLRIRGIDRERRIVEREGLVLDHLRLPGYRVAAFQAEMWKDEITTLVNRQYTWEWKNIPVKSTLAQHLDGFMTCYIIL